VQSVRRRWEGRRRGLQEQLISDAVKNDVQGLPAGSPLSFRSRTGSAVFVDKKRVGRGLRTFTLTAEALAGIAALVIALTTQPLQGPHALPIVALCLGLAIASDAFVVITGRGF